MQNSLASPGGIPMLQARELTELHHYFAMKTDLAAAVRDAAPDDIDFHLNELATMQMHTTSDKLRRACRMTLLGHLPPAAVARA